MPVKVTTAPIPACRAAKALASAPRSKDSCCTRISTLSPLSSAERTPPRARPRAARRNRSAPDPPPRAAPTGRRRPPHSDPRARAAPPRGRARWRRASRRGPWGGRCVRAPMRNRAHPSATILQIRYRFEKVVRAGDERKPGGEPQEPQPRVTGPDHAAIFPPQPVQVLCPPGEDVAYERVVHAEDRHAEIMLEHPLRKEHGDGDHLRRGLPLGQLRDLERARPVAEIFAQPRDENLA